MDAEHVGALVQERLERRCNELEGRVKELRGKVTALEGELVRLEAALEHALGIGRDGS